MRRPVLFRHIAAFFVALFPAAAFAHPGHDGGHDLTWDFVGELLHRLSSPYHLAPVAIAGLIAFGVWKLARRKRDAEDKE